MQAFLKELSFSPHFWISHRMFSVTVTGQDSVWEIFLLFEVLWTSICTTVVITWHHVFYHSPSTFSHFSLGLLRKAKWSNNFVFCHLRVQQILFGGSKALERYYKWNTRINWYSPNIIWSSWVSQTISLSSNNRYLISKSLFICSGCSLKLLVFWTTFLFNVRFLSRVFWSIQTQKSSFVFICKWKIQLCHLPEE